jgi:branched-chain amino acid transport system ATP-binding protein
LATDALRLTELHAFYGESHVLHGVSFAVPEGALLALLGRNGAGKSTTIGAITGLVAQRRGGIELFGENIASLMPEAVAHRGVGLVPQGRRVFPTLTVRENLTVARHGSGQWTLTTVLDLFPRLRERQGQFAGSLSGGEQQMLAIGRALMGNPRLLLLDEPSEGLAPLIVAEVGRIIARLKQDGLSIVLVEQNIALALDLADRVVILTTGRCMFDDDVAAARARPQEMAQQLGVVMGEH